MTRRLTGIVWVIVALLSPTSVAAEDAPKEPISRSIEAFAKSCEVRAGVAPDAFKRGLQRPARDRRGWTIAVRSEDAAARLASVKQIAEAANATLHVVAASAVVGKYIGETEKNLAALFQKAEQNDWILFFDEADALFGKRTKVKDAHDRYANDAASTMPTRLLAYSGLVVLGMRRTDAAPMAVARFADAVVTNRQKPAEKFRRLPWKTLCRVKRAK